MFKPVSATDVKPDMSLLRLIKLSELTRGNKIGSGAFGSVFQVGLPAFIARSSASATFLSHSPNRSSVNCWIPDINQMFCTWSLVQTPRCVGAFCDIKIVDFLQGAWKPSDRSDEQKVAIKVLREGTSPNQSKELLDEARIMASVVHPNCVQILCICMSAQMMLVTQLMPLGCLLDFVRRSRENPKSPINAAVMLKWCSQIAEVHIFSRSMKGKLTRFIIWLMATGYIFELWGFRADLCNFTLHSRLSFCQNLIWFQILSPK